jgi:lauroyl/myristoyl acyltransferase
MSGRDEQRASARERIFAQRWLHRAYPFSVGMRYARFRADRQWTESRTRDHARLQMQAVTGLPESGALDEVAKRYVFEMAKRDELSWRLWLSTRIPVDRIDVLREAQAHGGVILSFMHHGQFGGVFGSVGRHGIETHIASDPWFFSQESRRYNGYRGRQHLRTISHAGGRPFPAAKGAYERMRKLLEDGAVVAIASDLPGTTPAEFLGRTIGVPSGAPRLAVETGALVVPITAHRDGDFQRLVVEDPIDPAASDDLNGVLAEILRRHEPAIRAWPEAVERPLRRFRPLTDEDIARYGEDPAGDFFFQHHL